MSDARMFLRCGNCKYHLFDELDGSCVCISGCMDELVRMRLALLPKAEKAWSEDEVTAQVIAFQALRRMEENDAGRK